THRTHQASAPLFRPVTTDVKGERRFIATIARRLDSLGAITRGQRDSQTAMGGSDAALFRESDNLESDYAKAALRQFYGALWRGSIEGWNLERFDKATGLKLTWEGNLKEDLPPMPRFLNRLLALPIAEQNQLFAELEERIASNIEAAIEAGSYEVGVETVTADSLTIAGREALYEHPGTGAATELVEIVRRDRLEPLTAEAALEIGKRDPGPDGKPRLVVNSRSKRAAVLLPAPSRMLDDGGVQERVQLIRPATRERMAQAEFTASNWGRTDERHWRMLWDHEIGELPSHRESRFWLACGLLLPVWDRLPAENMRVRRLAADCGTALIGRVLDAEQVRSVRAGFGLDGGPAMTGAEAFEAVMGRGNALALANGWRLARRRLMGADRIEIEGPADTDLPALRRMGCTVEIVSFRARIFAPKPETLERLLDRWPLAA
ncbi:MAG: methylase, partial [Rhodospirillaceae bacterium]|nr:methylase [Rhodospirillaceae bacterium]